jgi:hypothetical protein
MKGNGPKKAFGWRWGLLVVSGLSGLASFGPVLLIMLALAIVFGGALLSAWAQKIMG